MEKILAYIPMDRRQAMQRGQQLPERVAGAALFADISGFTQLTEALAQELGRQRGAEELTYHLNRVYDALIASLHRFGGSVISFAGDAITCWFTDDDGLRATACSLAMQEAMTQFASITIPSGREFPLAMKTAVAVGPARRFLVGDANIQLIDVLAGSTLNDLASAEKQAERGEVVLSATAVSTIEPHLQISEWRSTTHGQLAVVTGLSSPVDQWEWPPVDETLFADAAIRPYLLPAIYDRLSSGQGDFLAELRPGVTLFMCFSGIDFDNDDTAGDKLNTFIQRVQQCLAQLGGNLLHITFGDKGSYLSAGFGVPIAHEDDAARAANAALLLRDLADSLAFIDHVQIGIASGRMRAGAYGGTLRRTYGVIGETVNLAARLMQTAVSNQILASQAVYEATADAFDWQPLPSITVKGIREAIAIAALQTAKSQPSRLQGSRYALPMVGRARERQLIADRLTGVVAGFGQVVAIVAEAGMGKSRLVAEAMQLAEESQLTRLSGECQSYATNSSYFAWQTIWQAFFGVDDNQSTASQIATLNQKLAAVNPALLPRLPLLGAVFNIAIPDNNLTRSFDAKLRKTSLESLLVECLQAQARQRPLLLVLEDIHWLDPLSRDLLQTIARAITNLPVMLIATYRPDSSPQQATHLNNLPHLTEIGLKEFTAQETEELIRLKLGQLYGTAVDIPQDLVTRINKRAAGNPFYIEELINYWQNRRVNLYDMPAIEQQDLPSSLHSLILSRIDQLTESQKGVIKVASVIGRLFKAAMVWGVYPQLGSMPQVKADLDTLCELDLTPLETPEPELTYLFKNIITQEVAYENLPYFMRATLHELIAQYIENHYTDQLDSYIDLLAYHYEHSHNELKKRTYLLRAGELAQANFANEAAISYYQRVLPLLPQNERVPIMLKLGEVLQLVGQWTEATTWFEDALALARQSGNLRWRAWCQSTIGEHLRKQGLFDKAEMRLNRSLANFEELQDDAGVAQVLHYSGTLAAQRGDYDSSRTLYERSLQMRRQQKDLKNISSTLNNLGIIARYQSNFDEARELYEESLSLRQQIGDNWAVAVSLNNLGLLALHVGDLDSARQYLQESVTQQRTIGDRWYLANSLNNLANVAREQADHAVAYDLYRESLQINQTLGDKSAIAYVLEDICCLAVALQQPHRAVLLYSAAQMLRAKIGSQLPPKDQEKLDEQLAIAQNALSAKEYTTAKQTGQTWDLSAVIDYALSEK